MNPIGEEGGLPWLLRTYMYLFAVNNNMYEESVMTAMLVIPVIP
jgi:hypothetical protein